MSETKKGKIREMQLGVCFNNTHLINLDVLNLKILKGGFKR